MRIDDATKWAKLPSIALNKSPSSACDSLLSHTVMAATDIEHARPSAEIVEKSISQKADARHCRQG